MVTYNHEKYIRKAIEGILMQKTEFKFELLIADDSSTDDTSLICNYYQNLCPGIIKFIHRQENLGSIANFTDLFGYCNGRYIAICEGDDYWIDPYKLQKQVDFLESHDNIVACFHDTLIINADGHIIKNYYPKPRFDLITIKDMLWLHYVPTASLIFRNNIIRDYVIPNEILSGDRFLELSLAMHGDFYRMSEEMCVHLKHESGLSKSAKHQNTLNRLQSNFKLYGSLKKIAFKENKKISIFNPKIATSSMCICIFYFKRFRLKNMVKYFVISMYHFCLNPLEFFQQKYFR